MTVLLIQCFSGRDLNLMKIFNGIQAEVLKLFHYFLEPKVWWWFGAVKALSKRTFEKLETNRLSYARWKYQLWRTSAQVIKVSARDKSASWISNVLLTPKIVRYSEAAEMGWLFGTIWCDISYSLSSIFLLILWQRGCWFTKTLYCLYWQLISNNTWRQSRVVRLQCGRMYIFYPNIAIGKEHRKYVLILKQYVPTNYFQVYFHDKNPT